MVQLILACIAFVGTHLLLSHPLRAPLVARAGEGAFLGIYSLVAFLTLGWMVWAYRAIPDEPFLWEVGDGLWAVATVVTLLAAVLFMGSLLGNPAMPNPGATDDTPPTEARGVFAITRHPMMWSFALWSLAHALVFPQVANLVLVGTIAFLALVGAWAQDRKKEQLRPTFWRAWEAKTSFWPFAAVAGGRARLAGFRGHDLGGGLVIWLAGSWAHIPLAGWAAGVFRWV